MLNFNIFLEAKGMNYYVMEQDMDYTDCPVIMNWFGKIDTENIKQGRYEKLKKRYEIGRAHV